MNRSPQERVETWQVVIRTGSNVFLKSILWTVDYHFVCLRFCLGQDWASHICWTNGQRHLGQQVRKTQVGLQKASGRQLVAGAARKYVLVC